MLTNAQLLIYSSLILLAVIIVLALTKLKKRAAKKLLEQEDRSGRNGIEFKTLEAFMMHLPEYCIKDDIASRLLRHTLETVGAEFQQRVFVDTTGGADKTCWLRKKGNTFIHEKGFYFDPIYYTKPIVYHFKDDSRPIVDKANDAGWQNSDMCSRYIFSAVNTADINARKGDRNNLLMIAGAIILAILIVGFVSYNGTQQEKAHYETLYNLINQTRGGY